MPQVQKFETTISRLVTEAASHTPGKHSTLPVRSRAPVIQNGEIVRTSNKCREFGPAPFLVTAPVIDHSGSGRGEVRDNSVKPTVLLLGRGVPLDTLCAAITTTSTSGSGVKRFSREPMEGNTVLTNLFKYSPNHSTNHCEIECVYAKIFQS
ncbi:hypothetical protein EVAR_39191_1 [Eumeta japonica]|uniref:Uncharacterized protein n=1 Tax=Eumeta variegata TaxID=151549 RepID=A0A4C1VMP1_EUMVA|nr:hypothetical protein EVAR_39191_1 [Eumeta japonica]